MRILILGLLIFPTAANAGWFNYDSYDDCILGKMKGQNQSVYSSAVKECKRLFKIEVDIFENVKFRFEAKQRITILNVEDLVEYTVTKAEILISTKSCAESKTEDFKPTATIDIRSGTGTVLSLFQCAKTVGFRGTYK